MRNLLAGLIAGLSIFAAMPAVAAQPPAVEADLRCVAIVAITVSSTEGEARAGVIAGLMYFIGRIDGSVPGISFENELRRVYEALTDEQVKSERQRCGGILQAKGQQLQSIGQSLQAKP